MKLLTNKQVANYETAIGDQQNRISELELRISELESINDQWIAYATHLEAKLGKYGNVITDYKIASGAIKAHKVSNGDSRKVYAMELPGMPPMPDNKSVEFVAVTPTDYRSGTPTGYYVAKDRVEHVTTSDNKSTPIVKSNGNKPKSVKTHVVQKLVDKLSNPQGAKSKIVYDMVKTELKRDLTQDEQNWIIMKVEFWTSKDSSVSVTECTNRAIAAIKSNKISKA